VGLTLKYHYPETMDDGVKLVAYLILPYKSLLKVTKTLLYLESVLTSVNLNCGECSHAN